VVTDNVTLVIYDITDDDLRNKVAHLLKKQGLKRIQKSAFAGKITSSQRSEVIAGLKRLVKDEKVNIQIYVLTETIFRNREVIGVEINYDGETVVIT
jgi:CRISPR-associated endoribonuclease Cas2